MTDNYGQSAEATAELGSSARQPRVVAERYALLAELGRGGMGVVWRAEDRMIGRHVAVKELRAPDGAGDAAVFQERILREVRTGGRINDPAVVTVFDVVTDGDATFIVMELVEAPTLSEVVRREGPLSAARVASIGDQVLSALQAAHEAGIVHRDVKPGNIMVSDGGRVKLTDFGIAQAVDDPRLTTSGNLVGSPAFMSPERVAGSDAVPASDLWSLGASLYFAVEGIVAFERTSTAATLHAIMNEVPYLTRTQGPVASAIMGLLNANPTGRLSVQQARGLLAAAGTPGGQPGTPAQGQPTPGPAGAGTMRATYGIPGQPAGSARPRSRAVRNWLRGSLGVAGVALLVGGLFIGKWIFGPTVDDRMRPSLTYGAGGDIPTVHYNSSYACLNTGLSKGVGLTDSNWIDCAEPHLVEFYGSVTTYGGSSSDEARQASYPGQQRIRRTAQSFCGMMFHSNVIKNKLRPALEYRALIPTQQQWQRVPESGEPARAFYCVLTRADGGQLTGSARNELR